MRESTLLLTFVLVCPTVSLAQQRVARTWDEAAIRDMHLPLAVTGKHAEPVAASYYERIPERRIFRSYPVYHPDHEPPGYMEHLRSLEPEVVFEAGSLRAEEDWVRAGKHVFETPIVQLPAPMARGVMLENPAWWEFSGAPLTKDGVLPFVRWMVEEQGNVTFGFNSCATCHTRVMPDGSAIQGAQGNFRLDAATAFLWQAGKRLDFARKLMHEMYGMPEVEGLETPDYRSLSLDEIVELQSSAPAGAIPRQGTSPLSPVQIPDLIGLEHRKYLDRTGLVRHRGIEDLMRYAALNQGGDMLGSYAGFIPAAGPDGELPPPETLVRYSDEQLYALARFLYSLSPPANPHLPDELTERGQEVFMEEGCAKCHEPPLYTNNRLVPVPGFEVPEEHRELYDIQQLMVYTDPTLSLTTRRGTGYYKVPSLLGVWYRGPFTHDGSIATLEDWFDPERLESDYVPTGWEGPRGRARPIVGHEFGLDLVAGDKQALIAFLRTL